MLRCGVASLPTRRRIGASVGSFRSTDRERLAHVYGAMGIEGFEAVNGPQEALNALLIPLALADHPARRPWRIVDLGCGTGASSATLLEHAPRGSALIGYDLCKGLLARARERSWLDSAAAPIDVDFVCSPVDGPLRDAQSRLLEPASIDLVHAAGLVGHHFEVASLRRLAAEVQRILADDGIAVLDAGPKLRARDVTRVMVESGFVPVGRHRLWPLAKRMALTFERRRSSEPAGGRMALSCGHG